MILAVLACCIASCTVAIQSHLCRVAVRRIRAAAEADRAALISRVAGLEHDLAALECDLTSGTDRQALAAIERLARGGYGPSFTQCAVITNSGAEMYGAGHDAFIAAILRQADWRLK